MLASVPYIIFGLIIAIGVLRCVRDRKKRNKWRLWSQHLSETLVVLLVYAVMGLILVSVYLNKTNNVYATYETVELEDIKSTVQSPKMDNVFLQGSRSTSNSSAKDYYLVKTDGRKVKISSFDTTINYRPLEHRMIVKSIRVKDSSIAQILHLKDAVQEISYQVFLPVSGVDLATNPQEKDYTEYPAP